MSTRPVGIVSINDQASVVASNLISLNPTRVIQIVEFGVSMNESPDGSSEPGRFEIRRLSTDGSVGGAATVVKMHDDFGAALTTTAREGDTTLGTVQDTLHQFYAPTVSGMIWVAAPGREFDCGAADFLALTLQTTLGAGVDLSAYTVFEE